MPNPEKPRVRQGIQFIELDELNAELHVINDDEAASLLWVAQRLDEHREYAVTAVRLDDTADPTTRTTPRRRLALRSTMLMNAGQATSAPGSTVCHRWRLGATAGCHTGLARPARPV